MCCTCSSRCLPQISDPNADLQGDRESISSLESHDELVWDTSPWENNNRFKTSTYVRYAIPDQQVEVKWSKQGRPSWHIDTSVWGHIFIHPLNLSLRAPVPPVRDIWYMYIYLYTYIHIYHQVYSIALAHFWSWRGYKHCGYTGITWDICIASTLQNVITSSPSAFAQGKGTTNCAMKGSLTSLIILWYRH